MSVGSFFLWAGTILDNFKESGNLLFSKVSLIHFLRKGKEKSHFFKIFTEISPPAGLFEDKPFTACYKFFINWLKGEFAGNFIVTFNVFNTGMETKAVCNSINTAIDLIR